MQEGIRNFPLLSSSVPIQWNILVFLNSELSLAHVTLPLDFILHCNLATVVASSHFFHIPRRKKCAAKASSFVMESSVFLYCSNILKETKEAFEIAVDSCSFC